MELESEEGATIPVNWGSPTHIGRALGFPSGPSSSDRTVSRRHLSLRLLDRRHDEFELQFEAIGRNPIVVRSAHGGGDRVYRNSEKGEIKPGDRVSLSLRTPFFWVVRRVGGEGEEGEVDRAVLDAVERREKRTLERRRMKEEEAARAQICGGEGDEEGANVGLESELAQLDLPQIDPVREFGFLVMGHEFDNYPKQKLRPLKNWNWYLEEPRENSDEEEEDEANGEAVTLMSKSKSMRRKKKGEERKDEDWTGESQDEEEFISKFGSAKRSKYSTRSKDSKKPRIDSMQREGVTGYEDEEFVEKEDDETTLGGFIVDDEDEEEAMDEEEGEEFDEEYDD